MQNTLTNSKSPSQGFSTYHLTPLEVLTSIQHAELQLERSFTKEEFVNGQVGGFMTPDDFDQEITVCLVTHLIMHIYWRLV